MAKQPGLAGNPNVDITDLRYQLSDKNTEISKLKLNLQSTQDELENTRRQLFDKKAEYNEAESRIMDLSADVGKWKSLANRGGGGSGGGGGGGNDSQLLQKDMEIEKLRREVVTVKKQLQDKDDELHEEKLRRNDRRQQIPTDHYRVQIQHVQTENSRLTSELLSLNDQLEQLRIDNNDLRYQLADGGKRHSQSGMYQGGGASFASLQDELDYYKREFDHLKQDYQSVVDTNTAMHQQALIYEDDFKREKQERDEANARFKNAQDEIQRLNTTIHELRDSPARRDSQVGNRRPDDYTESSGYRYAHTISHEDRDDTGRVVTNYRSFSPDKIGGYRETYNSPRDGGASGRESGDYYSQQQGRGGGRRESSDNYYYTPPREGGMRESTDYYQRSEEQRGSAYSSRNEGGGGRRNTGYSPTYSSNVGAYPNYQD